jgi:hypothetical protein
LTSDILELPPVFCDNIGDDPDSPKVCAGFCEVARQLISVKVEIEQKPSTGVTAGWAVCAEITAECYAESGGCSIESQGTVKRLGNYVILCYMMGSTASANTMAQKDCYFRNVADTHG